MAKRITSDGLRAKLQDADPGQLVSLLMQLAEEDDAIRDRAEALALRADPTAYADALRRRLARWTRGSRFISYGESTAFARQLGTWLDELEEGLLAVNPAAALKLTEAFIRSDRAVIGRADDSNGSIGDAYRRACGLWLQTAAQLGASPVWVDRLHDLHANNDYGVRDALLDDAQTLLSELELRRLATIYEHEFQTDATRTTAAPYRSLAAAAAMGQVARAAGDAALYERSVRLHSAHPNSLQALEVAKQYVRFGPVDKAVPWLAGPSGSGRDIERLELLAAAHEQLGDPARLLDVRRQLWERTLGAKDLREYLTLLPASERDEARRDAVKKGSRSDDVVVGASLLLNLEEIAHAEAVVWKLRDTLIDIDYSRLIELAKRLRPPSVR